MGVMCEWAEFYSSDFVTWFLTWCGVVSWYIVQHEVSQCVSDGLCMLSSMAILYLLAQ